MAVRRTTIVVTPTADQSLISLANYKIDVGIDALDTTLDAFLTRAIAKASAFAAQYCNRVFVAEKVTDTFDIGRARLQYFGEESLQLSRWPVGTIYSITQDSTALVNGTDYRVDLAAGLLYRLDSSGCDTSWIGTPVIITYDGGYAADAIPLDLQGAASEMVKTAQYNQTRDPSLRSENILEGLYAYTLFDASTASGSSSSGLAPSVQGVLDLYRVPVVG